MSSQTDHELPTDIINALNLRIDNLVFRVEDLRRRVEESDPGIHYFIPPSERPRSAPLQPLQAVWSVGV